MATPLFYVKVKPAEEIKGYTEEEIAGYLEAFPGETELQPKGKVPEGSPHGRRFAKHGRRRPDCPVYAVHRDTVRKEEGGPGFITFYYVKARDRQLHWADSRIFDVVDA